ASRPSILSILFVHLLRMIHRLCAGLGILSILRRRQGRRRRKEWERGRGEGERGRGGGERNRGRGGEGKGEEGREAAGGETERRDGRPPLLTPSPTRGVGRWRVGGRMGPNLPSRLLRPISGGLSCRCQFGQRTPHPKPL